MATPSPSTNWQKIFADRDRGVTLTPLELDAVNAAYANMTQPDVSKHGVIPDKDWAGSPFDKLEQDPKLPPEMAPTLRSTPTPSR